MIGDLDDLRVTPLPPPVPEPPTAPHRYFTLEPQTLAAYLTAHPEVAARLGGTAQAWRTREMGDGNLNLVFLVEGPRGSVVVKQALPYVRMVGTSWPLPLARAHYECQALLEQARWAAPRVPAVLGADHAMALTILEHLTPHRVLRAQWLAGVRCPDVGEHLGQFLGHTLYATSDLNLTAAAKKARMAVFLGNTAMCRISEDLIFDEPYFAAPMNRHTRPYLDDIVVALRADAAVKLAAQEMKWCFQNQPEALIHGDLHTGSVMVTADDTRVIDPEFAFYGPMGFDIGMILGNFLIAYLAQAGQETVTGERAAHRAHVLEQAAVLWHTFARVFAGQWQARCADQPGGDLYMPRLLVDAPALHELALTARLSAIWRQAVGYAGCEMIRRVVGLAHVADFESIADPVRRADCERHTVELGRSLLVEREGYAHVEAVLAAARDAGAAQEVRAPNDARARRRRP